MKLRKTWTTRDGEAIPVRDLTDDHLLNIWRMLERGAEAIRLDILADAYSFLGSCRGDGAVDAMEAEIAHIDRMDEAHVIKRQFPEIYAEMNRRDIWHRLDQDAPAYKLAVLAASGRIGEQL